MSVGISFSTGKPWADLRKYCRDTLRTYGFENRGAMEQIIQDELQHFTSHMDEERKRKKGKLHFSVDYFHLSFANIMASLVMGARRSYEDKDLQKLLKDSVDFVKNGVYATGLLNAYPFLRFIFPDSLGYNTQMKAAEGIGGYAEVRYASSTYLHITNTKELLVSSKLC